MDILHFQRAAVFIGSARGITAGQDQRLRLKIARATKRQTRLWYQYLRELVGLTVASQKFLAAHLWWH
jgi:hypothetical protein